MCNHLRAGEVAVEEGAAVAKVAVGVAAVQDILLLLLLEVEVPSQTRK